MKVLSVLVLLAAASAEFQTPEFCLEATEVGPCKGSFKRFGFNQGGPVRPISTVFSRKIILQGCPTAFCLWTT